MTTDTELREKTTLDVTGMTCVSCSARIEKNLAKLPGVLSANVNLATEKATVEYDPAAVDEAKMVHLIEDLGYGVRQKEAEKASFGVTGMTCASCSARVERTLSKMPGVQSASVNLATEKATVSFDPTVVSLADFRRAVEDVGYGIAEEVPAADGAPDAQTLAVRREIAAARNKVIVALSLGAVIMAGSFSTMIPGFPRALDFLGNPYLLWALATVVQFWAGWQFYRGAWANARHFSANMDTLIAMGTSAAYLYSAAAILFPTFFVAGGQMPELYFDTAAVIIGLI